MKVTYKKTMVSKITNILNHAKIKDMEIDHIHLSKDEALKLGRELADMVWDAPSKFTSGKVAFASGKATALDNLAVLANFREQVSCGLKTTINFKCCIIIFDPDVPVEET